MKECNCKDWKKNWGLIEGALVIAALHGQNERVKIFERCPWCGKKLLEMS
jgi:hypothetical protein